MTSTPTEPDIHPHSHHSTNFQVIDLAVAGGVEGKRFVDIGSGEGFYVHHLAKRVKELGGDPRTQITASEIWTENFRSPLVDCVQLDGEKPLPFPDGHADVTTCIEVIEHLENQFALVRELMRVTKPGGLVIVTTPNVLSLTSRFNYLGNGFTDLFGTTEIALPTPGYGHVHPIGLYYLRYLFARCGVTEMRVVVDRWRHSAIALLPFLGPLVLIRNAWFWWQEQRKAPARCAENRHITSGLNSLDVLLGRSLILVARKPL